MGLGAKRPAPWASLSLAGAWDEAVADTAASTPHVALTRYQRDPVGFLVDVLGVERATLEWSSLPEYARHAWDGSRDPIKAALEAIAAGQWIAVQSGTATGKTFAEAAAILWHCGSFPDSVAVTVATKEAQMVKGVWREVGRLWPRFAQRFPRAELTTLRIRMDPQRGDAWGAWAITAKVTADEQSNTSVQGLHAERLLILCDEMPGIPESIVTALVNTATDAGNVIAGFGNPDNESDPLAKFGRRSGVVSLRVSALDHPNIVTGRTIVPGAVSRGSIQKRADDYGVESPMYGSRVRGIAPKQAADALVHRAWVDAAIVRGVQWAADPKALDGYPKAYGVDPSNSDAGDEAAVARFLGPLCTSVRSKRCPDANALGLEVFLLAQGDEVDPRYIGVDSIGVGAGTVNESRRLYHGGNQFTALNSGAAPSFRATKGADGQGWTGDSNQFLNLRAQMYWQAREDLRKGLVGLPDDPELAEELIMPTYEVRAGKVVIEPKSDVRSRLGRSPNKADAFVYGNWVRPRTKPIPVASASRERDLGLIRREGKLRSDSPVDRMRRQVQQGHAPADQGWKGW